MNKKSFAKFFKINEIMEECMVEVSVIIPTKNRAEVITRALNSVCKQTLKNLEIIIVDDGSTDETESVIKQFLDQKKEIPIKYIKNKLSLGGAIARNQGAEIATGKYIAFLDSDDEWLPNHLSSGIQIIQSNNSNGVFGAFYTKSDIGVLKEVNVLDIPKDFTMADYIFSRIGDARTSTFIFESSCFKEIKFDERQEKHQDWDLAIRFCDKYKLSVNNERTVIIHYDSNNRMSNSMNHKATKYLLKKHINSAKPESLINFFLFLMTSTIKFEGKSKGFYEYWNSLEQIIKQYNISLSIKQNLKRFILRRFPTYVIKKIF